MEAGTLPKKTESDQQNAASGTAFKKFQSTSTSGLKKLDFGVQKVERGWGRPLFVDVGHGDCEEGLTGRYSFFFEHKKNEIIKNYWTKSCV